MSSFNLAALVFVAFAAAAPPSIPDLLRLDERYGSEIQWISERTALDDAGELRWEHFPEWRRQTLRRMLQANADGTCQTFLTQPPLEHHQPDRTLDEVVSNSNVIVSGTVVASGRGFYRGIPGTLLAVRTSERLKAVVRLSACDTVYVVIPEARIETKSGAICSTIRGALTSLPKPGDSILAFAFGTPNDEQASILEVDVARHLLVRPKGSERPLPNALAKALGDQHSFEEVIDRIRVHEGRTRSQQRRIP